MKAAIFAFLCRSGRSVLFARQSEMYALVRLTNGEADWEGPIQPAREHWVTAVESLLIALNGVR